MTRTTVAPLQNMPGQVLSTPVDTVGFIISKLREQENGYRDAAAMQELHSFIDDLPEGQQVDLVALAWLGRDNCSATDWPAVRGETAEAHYAQTARYLLGMSLVGDFLDEGLSILGVPGERVIAGQPSYRTGMRQERRHRLLRELQSLAYTCGMHGPFGGCLRRKHDGYGFARMPGGNHANSA